MCISNPSHRSFREDVNLYSHRQRKSFLKAAAEALECPTHQLRGLLEGLTDALEGYRLELRDAAKAGPQTAESEN